MWALILWKRFSRETCPRISELHVTFFLFFECFNKNPSFTLSEMEISEQNFENFCVAAKGEEMHKSDLLRLFTTKSKNGETKRVFNYY